MVQIRRKRRLSPHECIRRSIGGLLQFCAVSSVIPGTFWARHALFANKSSTTPNVSVTVIDKAEPPAATIATEPQANSEEANTASPTLQPVYLSFSTDDSDLERMFGFLNRVDYARKGLLWRSDVVELYHCNLQALDLTNFTTWAAPLVNQTLAQAEERLRKRNPPVIPSSEVWKSMQEEFVLELLEMRAQAAHLCDFEIHRPSVPMDPTSRSHVAQRLEALATRSNPDSQGTATRVVFSIVAHRDVEQLRRLIQAISLPQHYILLHLERRCPVEFEIAVNELASSFDNVVVLKFGTILYETDLVSMIQYRIMYWVTHVLQLPFDYWISLDGASFPLHSASELVKQLVKSERQIWMGNLLSKGIEVHSDQTSYLRTKRLFATHGDDSFKLVMRLPRPTFRDQLLPQAIVQYMNKKTNSGNQAVYSRAIVEELVASPAVRELFTLSKYGCCCCLEERTWIAAMGLIGRQGEALEQASVWQTWGGREVACKSSMRNAVLTRNATVCYKVEDGTTKPEPSSLVFDHGRYFRGNETWAYLQNARNRGILFARKFDSENALSMELMNAIEERMWPDKTTTLDV